MAELGLVASIFGVASFGTKVATSLYEAADIMIHAHQQIASMAKHVVQFTAILRHLGKVLEAERGSYSSDLLREIRKIKRSCKATLKEISATTRSRYRSLVPVRWLFRKSKAKELEARLDSEQSMLQIMINTITVSKMGDMHSKSKEGSKQLADLTEQITEQSNILKTLIIENHNNLTELQRAEKQSEAEAREPSPEDVSQQSQQLFPKDYAIRPSSGTELHTNEIPFQRPASPASGLSESETEGSDLGITENDIGRMSSQDHVNQSQARYPHGRDHTKVGKSSGTVQPLPARDRVPDSKPPKTSTLLLQMVPYRPTTYNSDRLLGAGPDGPASSNAKPKPIMQEVAGSVLLLLDKWTTSGSGPVADILAEKESSNIREGYPAFPPPPRQRRQTEDFDPSEFDDEVDGLSGDEYKYERDFHRMPRRPPPERPYHPYDRAPMLQPVIMECDGQISDASPQQINQARYILNAMSNVGGGIFYMKRSNLQHMLYIDEKEFYRFDLVPQSLINTEDSIVRATEIGKGWIRREALDLLGYAYTETISGNFSIPRNLPFDEIEEIVRLSFQGFSRGLKERSRQIIEERGWSEAVASIRRVSEFPSVRDRSYDRTRVRPIHLKPGSRMPYDTPGPYDSEPDGYQNAQYHQFHHRPIYVDEKLRPVVREEQNGKVSDVRFTLPRMSSASPNTTAAGAQKGEALSARIDSLEEKLKSLIKKRDEAIKSDDYSTNADLTSNAISELQSYIEHLKQVQRDEDKAAPAEKERQVPRVEVETDSGSSEESEG